MPDLRAVLTRGYFPEELPPPFNTASFAAAVDDNVGSLPEMFIEGNKQGKVAIHNLAQVGTLRRSLGLPNPVHQYRLAKQMCDNWAELSVITGASSLSASTPREGGDSERAITRSKDFGELPVQRADVRATSKYILRTDVTRFYHSIYTHSIPWAIHGKSFAKANRSPALLGNRIDKAIRDGQDGQTLGVPVGPDTSLVLAEVLMSRVDIELCKPKPVKGFRYIDDYELGFDSRAEAEATLATLEECLAEYELSLNPNKTAIIETPAPFDNPWASELRIFPIRDSRTAQFSDLLRFFERGFELARLFPAASVLKYCISRIFAIEIKEGNWNFVRDLLLQCMISEPGVLPKAIRVLLEQQKAGRPVQANKLRAALHAILSGASQSRHSSEVAWAVWASILFNLPITNETSRHVARVPDSVVALLMLDARERGLIEGEFECTLWSSVMDKDELYEEQWLLAYEAQIKGWLPSRDGGNHVRDDKAFSFLREHGVSFYLTGDPVAVTEEHRQSAPRWVTGASPYS